ncbi:PaaI family thioesterase [Sphingomonas sp.]|uniref:PaaI family thioesterase n=1 Tax=Sphingomonas sp. TaxID=28214 RepID=UPI002ED971B2
MTEGDSGQAGQHRFVYEDDPELSGWKRWSLSDTTRFNSLFGPFSVLVADGLARVRFTPQHAHSNLRGDVHGGALLGFMDMALFAAGRSYGVLTAGTAATLDLSAQFIAGAPVSAGAVEARVELLRQTRRFLFMRGLIVQGEATIASFSGTVRKPGS